MNVTFCATYLALFTFLLAGQTTRPTSASPGWEVSGTVIGRHGPVKDIFVIGSGPEFVKTARTDSQGRFRLQGQSPGTYTFRVQKPEDAGLPPPRTVTVAHGVKIPNVDFNLPQGAAIEGKVVGLAGEGLDGIAVIAYELVREGDRELMLSRNGSRTKGGGKFRIPHLAPGKYAVAAVTTVPRKLEAVPAGDTAKEPRRISYPPVTFSPQGRSLAGASVLRLRESDVYMGADSQLKQEKTYCVSFQPVLPSSDMAGLIQPVLYVSEWVGTHGPYVTNQLLKQWGEHQLCGLPSGEYLLGLLGMARKEKKGYSYTRTRIVVDERDIDVGPQHMAGLATMSGEIRFDGHSGNPPALDGVLFSLLRRERQLQPNDMLRGNVEENGTFSLAGVYPDTYSIVLENLPERCYVRTMAQGAISTQFDVVKVPGEKITFALSCDGPTISGKVLVERQQSNRPVPNAVVVLATTEGICTSVARSDQSGTYEFPSGIRPGRYKLFALEASAESIRPESAIPSDLLRTAETLSLKSREATVQDLVARPW